VQQQVTIILPPEISVGCDRRDPIAIKNNFLQS